MYFEFLDIFGVNFNFTFKKKYLYKTNFSICLSIILIILSIGFASYNLKNMINRKILNINYFQSIINTNESLILDDSNSFLGLHFEFSDDIDAFEKFSQFFAIFNYANSKIDNNEYPLYTSSCKNNYVNSDSIVENDIQCLDFNNSKLKGNYYGMAESSFIHLDIKFYNNKFISVFNKTFHTKFVLSYC